MWPWAVDIGLTISLLEGIELQVAATVRDLIWICLFDGIELQVAATL